MEINKKTNIIIGSDQGGFELKESIKANFNGVFEFIDIGTYSLDSVDYPDIASSLSKRLLADNTISFGILICGTGIGISIAANKIKGIRCALCYSKEVAVLAKEHNNANVLAFGGRTMEKKRVFDSIIAYANASFSDAPRHKQRVEKIKAIEENE